MKGVRRMQLKVYVSEEEFDSGEILKKKDPPVIEFRDKDGWVKRAKLSDLDKLPQFKGANAEFLSELKDKVDSLSDNIERISTKELVEELKKREGVSITIAEPYEKESFEVEGPAIVLTVID